MSRDFISMVISRAVREEVFRQLLQQDARAAADAMELTYNQDDLRGVEALSSSIADLDSDAARQYLQGIAAQDQSVFGSPQRPAA